MKVSLEVTNSGSVDGKEVVQLYLSVPETDNFKDEYRSPKDLKGFAKVDLAAGETKTVTIELDDQDFSYWNVD